MAQRNLTELVAGAVVLLVAIGFLGYAVANTGRGHIAGYTLNARFQAIDGLGIGADVRLAGVKVGSVNSARIDPQTYQAIVSFSVEPSIRLPTDSSAEITSDGLLGGKYVRIEPGHSQKLLEPNGQLTKTRDVVVLEQVLGRAIFLLTEQ